MSTSIATGDGLKKIEILEGWKKSDGSIVYGSNFAQRRMENILAHPGLMGFKTSV